MTSDFTSEKTDPNQVPHRIYDRTLGSWGGTDAGPLLIVVTGLHGNEPAGIEASRRVLARLEKGNAQLNGRIVAFTGNLPALEQNQRYIDQDLNRMWMPNEVRDRFGRDDAELNVEEQQQRELIDSVEAEIAHARGHVIVADLHSTSADAPPFSIISDTLQNRRIAFALSMPVILGLEEAIKGTIQEYFAERGYVTMAIEGGQHDHPKTPDILESALWLLLAATGLLAKEQVRDFAGIKNRMTSLSEGLPSVVEVFFRHAISPEDAFCMNPGFENFSPVSRGQVVARDRKGNVHAPDGGMLVLPSYQGIGDDGFFLGRKVQRLWLRVSTLLRHIKLDRLLPLFPGIRKHPHEPDTLLANPSVTRWETTEIFHLLGFRKCKSDNGLLVYKRRLEKQKM